MSTLDFDTWFEEYVVAQDTSDEYKEKKMDDTNQDIHQDIYRYVPEKREKGKIHAQAQVKFVSLSFSSSTDVAFETHSFPIPEQENPWSYLWILEKEMESFVSGFATSIVTLTLNLTYQHAVDDETDSDERTTLSFHLVLDNDETDLCQPTIGEQIDMQSNIVDVLYEFYRNSYYASSEYRRQLKEY